MSMADWATRLDAFLSFNERPVLTHAGKLRAEVAEQLALTCYDSFNNARQQLAARQANEEDLTSLEALQQQASAGHKKPAD